jgi:putative hydrolase of the HAD superfamily
MFRSKSHLFFDLDHTLWDYEASSNETLQELWVEYKLDSKGVPLNSFVGKFSEVNEELWRRLHAGEINKDVIRNDRFPSILSALAIEDNALATDMQQQYIHVCPTKPYLIDGAMELLESVTGRYGLHIITNGFDEIQGVKLRSGGIEHFFEEVITSGIAGYQKPDKQIFDFAMNKTKAKVEDSVMIGDNPLSDIEGAFNAGIDQVFFNPHNQQCPITPTLEIKSLRELMEHV